MSPPGTEAPADCQARPSAQRGARAGDIAGKWVRTGRIALLLDGLDEVSAERRAKVAQLLNETYLKRSIQTPILITSRIDEYKPLVDREPELHLPGAVILSPLSDAKIDELLEKRAVALRYALCASVANDKAWSIVTPPPIPTGMRAWQPIVDPD